MGNDPVNLIDPSGGISIDFGAVGQFTGSVVADRALATLGGAALGYGIDRLLGGNGWTGAAIGGGLGLSATFVPPFNIGAIGGALKDAAPNIAAQGAGIAADIVTQGETNPYAQWAGYSQRQLPSFSTLLSNYPKPYKIRPDRTPINPKLPLDDVTGANFLHFNQCAIRVSLALRRSGISLAGAKNITNPGYSPYGNGNILGATNLAVFLLKFTKPEEYDGTKTDVAIKLKNRTGIVYFQRYNDNYGTSLPIRRRNSNVHIDLWNRNEIMAPYTGQMLDASIILFWPLK